MILHHNDLNDLANSSSKESDNKCEEIYDKQSMIIPFEVSH